MAAVKELLKAETDGTLSFGDYTLGSKTKLEGFEFQGDLYKVKTFSEITKRCHFPCQAAEMRSLHWESRRTAHM